MICTVLVEKHSDDIFLVHIVPYCKDTSGLMLDLCTLVTVQLYSALWCVCVHECVCV